MAERIEAVTARNFAILPTWVDKRSTDGGDELLESTVARLRIDIGNEIITQFRTDRGDSGEAVEIPVYHLAEWIAESWWSLLFEPLKSEEEEASHQFIQRHWMGSARSGFALPDVMLVPNDGHVELTAKASYLKFSRMTFEKNAEATIATSEVEHELRQVVERTIARLELNKIQTSSLQSAWKLIRETEPEAVEFCRLMGSLGLSPYSGKHEKIEDLIIRLNSKFSTEALRDLCQAASPESIARVAESAEKILDKLDEASEIDLGRLDDLECRDDMRHAAWQWGVAAARKVRDQLGILHSDKEGAAKVFGLLGINPGEIAISRDAGLGAVVAGAVDRSADAVRLALLEDKEPQRRFMTARATFLGWQAKNLSSRLVTGAKTRDQQASRAFAAEVLAPIGYIKAKAKNRYLTPNGVAELARECQVSPAVISYQARNNHISIG